MFQLRQPAVLPPQRNDVRQQLASQPQLAARAVFRQHDVGRQALADEHHAHVAADHLFVELGEVVAPIEDEIVVERVEASML